MTYQPDHPHVRRAFSCPMCGEPKPIGNVTCWPCHNECESGTEEQRTARESTLDRMEVELCGS